LDQPPCTQILPQLSHTKQASSQTNKLIKRSAFWRLNKVLLLFFETPLFLGRSASDQGIFASAG
jgi:hypothetical protein